MGDFNYGLLTDTTHNASAASVTATATAVGKKQLQLIGFDGSSNDQAFKVELYFGSELKLRMQGSADNSAGRGFDPKSAPVAPTGENITVVTTPSATGDCTANVIYRIVM